MLRLLHHSGPDHLLVPEYHLMMKSDGVDKFKINDFI